MTGNLIAQLITFGTAPVITRLFTPDNFGTLGIFTAFVLILSPVGSLCYERAILLPKSDDDAINLWILSGIILIIMTCVLSIVCFLGNHFFANIFKSPEMSFWILFLPAGFFISCIYKNYRFWFLRQKRFNNIAVSRILQAFVSAGIKISAGFVFGAVSGWLIGSFLIGIFFSFLSLFFICPNLLIQPTISFDRKEIVKLAVQYRQFPLFASWNALLNFLSQNISVFLLAIYFSPTIVGFYSLAARILKQPILTISESVQNVYFQKSASQRANETDIRRGLQKIIVVLFLIGIVPFAILLFSGRIIFAAVFGAEWESAGLYAQIMTPWFFALFISSPANVVFEVFQRQDIKLKINFLKAAFRFCGLLTGCIVFKDPVWALGLFIVPSVLGEIVLICLSYQLTRHQAY